MSFWESLLSWARHASTPELKEDLASESKEDVMPFDERLLLGSFGLRFHYFISYSSKDATEFALAITRNLQIEGLRVYLDRDKGELDKAPRAENDWRGKRIPGKKKEVGESIWEELSLSWALLVVATEEYCRSEWCARELRTFAAHGRPIVIWCPQGRNPCSELPGVVLAPEHSRLINDSADFPFVVKRLHGGLPEISSLATRLHRLVHQWEFAEFVGAPTTRESLLSFKPMVEEHIDSERALLAQILVRFSRSLELSRTPAGDLMPARRHLKHLPLLARNLKHLERILTDEGYRHEVFSLMDQGGSHQHAFGRRAILNTASIGKRRTSADLAVGVWTALSVVGGRETRGVSDPVAISLLGDAVVCAIERGDLQQAIDLYFGPLGRYQRLGENLGQYQLGERIARILARNTEDLPGDLRRLHHLMLTDWALYLVNLGRLTEAEEIHNHNANADVWKIEPGERATILANLASCRLRLGRTKQCQEAVRQGLEIVDGKDHPASQELLNLWKAECSVLLGETELALDGYRKCLDCQDRLGEEDLPLYQLRGFHLQWTLLRTGLTAEAEAQAHAVRSIHDREDWREFTARTEVVLAECMRRKGEVTEARESVEAIWLTCRDNGWQELALYCLLVDTWILLDLGLWREASDVARQGLDVSSECSYGLMEVDFLCARANALLGKGDKESALEHTEAALDSADGNIFGRISALAAREKALQALDRKNEATNTANALKAERNVLSRLRSGLERLEIRT